LIDFFQKASGGLEDLRLASRFVSEQVAHEEIHAPAAGVGGFSNAVTAARNDQQVEIFVRFDKRVDYLHG
jgi:hypothetical protein